MEQQKNNNRMNGMSVAAWRGYMKGKVEAIEQNIKSIQKIMSKDDNRIRSLENRVARIGAISGIVASVLVWVISFVIRDIII